MSQSRIFCVVVLLLPGLAFANDFDRGAEALGKNDYDLAIACFNAAHIKENTVDASAYRQRGIAYYSKKDYGKAIEDYSQVIRLDPKYANAYLLRAFAYDRNMRPKPERIDEMERN